MLKGKPPVYQGGGVALEGVWKIGKDMCIQGNALPDLFSLKINGHLVDVGSKASKGMEAGWFDQASITYRRDFHISN